jgi:MFS family permease
VASAAAALGPVVGGALAHGLSWHWIFWLNVPLGLALIPWAHRRLDESHGPHGRLDLPGIALSGAALLAYVGMLGALFLVGQLMQVGLGASPLGAGLRLLPMTTVMLVGAPVAGRLCDRLGPRRLMAGALALEALALAWLAQVVQPGVAYAAVAVALVPIGLGAASLFAPIQAALLSAVRPAEQGQAAGAATAFRELGGVLGVAVLATVFAAHGGGQTSAAFLTGFGPALRVGAAAVALAALAALALPRPARAPRRLAPQPA